ncbi:MAG: hypothetical protein ACFB03_17795 [Paracoccaceae bacterium]
MTDLKAPESIADSDLDKIEGGYGGGAMGDEPAMIRDAKNPGKKDGITMKNPSEKGVLSSLQTG